MHARSYHILTLTELFLFPGPHSRGSRKFFAQASHKWSRECRYEQYSEKYALSKPSACGAPSPPSPYFFPFPPYLSFFPPHLSLSLSLFVYLYLSGSLSLCLSIILPSFRASLFFDFWTTQSLTFLYSFAYFVFLKGCLPCTFYDLCYRSGKSCLIKRHSIGFLLIISRARHLGPIPVTGCVLRAIILFRPCLPIGTSSSHIYIYIYII